MAEQTARQRLDARIDYLEDPDFRPKAESTERKFNRFYQAETYVEDWLQRRLLDYWLRDQNDMVPFHRDAFFDKHKSGLTFEILKEVFVETLGVLINDTVPPVQRSIRHLSGLYGYRIVWANVQKSSITKEKESWDQIYRQREFGGYDEDKFIELFPLLREEVFYLGHTLNKFEGHERYLEQNPPLPVPPGCTLPLPTGFIEKRRGEI